MQLWRSIDQMTFQVGPFLFSCFLVKSYVDAHAYTYRIKDGPVSPLSVCRAFCRTPCRRFNGSFFPHFSCQIEKGLHAWFMPETFPRCTAPAAPCSCAHCTYRCRTDHVVSRLYRRAVLMYRCIAFDIAAGRKLTTGAKVHTYIEGKEPVRCQDSAISVPILWERR